MLTQVTIPRFDMATITQVNVPVLNIYAQANEESEVVSQALYGWQVVVLDEYSYFKRIRTEDNYEGWVLSWGLYTSTSIAERPTAFRLAKIIHNAVHIYAAPDVKKQKPLLTLPFEVTLRVLAEPEGDDRRWIQVELVNGKAAWIQRGNVSINPSLLTLSQTLKLSSQFIGVPYTWGGSSSFGFDCSGFIQMLFRQQNIILPRDACLQHAYSHSIPNDFDNLEPGDLIFFGSSAESIKHVGLYLGNEELVHASVKPLPMVQKISLDDRGLKQRFAYWAARRVKNEQFCLATLPDDVKQEKNLACLNQSQ